MAERTELLMVERAIRQGWSVPPDEITKALELIERLLQDPTSTPRQKERARRTLLVIEESRN